MTFMKQSRVIVTAQAFPPTAEVSAAAQAVHVAVMFFSQRVAAARKHLLPEVPECFRSRMQINRCASLA